MAEIKFVDIAPPNGKKHVNDEGFFGDASDLERLAPQDPNELNDADTNEGSSKTKA